MYKILEGKLTVSLSLTTHHTHARTSKQTSRRKEITVISVLPIAGMPSTNADTFSFMGHGRESVTVGVGFGFYVFVFQ